MMKRAVRWLLIWCMITVLIFSTIPITATAAEQASETLPEPSFEEVTELLFATDDWETYPAQKMQEQQTKRLLLSAPSTTTAYINISGMKGYTNTETGSLMAWHFIDDGGYVQTAWCIQPSAMSVNKDTYSYDSALSNQTLKDVLQIAYEIGYWANGSTPYAEGVAATQVAVWWAMGFTSSSCNNSSVNSMATSLYNAALADAGCGAGALYKYRCTSNSSHQLLATYYPERAEKLPELAELEIIKIDSDTRAALKGVGYRLFNEKGEKVGEGYTDRYGKLTFSDLPLGKYTYQEFHALEGFELDDTVYEADLTDGETLQVYHENFLKRGSLTVHKVDAAGNSLTGVSVLLEKSTDGGTTWKAVGTKTTGTDGIAAWTDLAIGTKTRYRITETATLPGYFLMGTPIYEGSLPASDNYDVVITACNSQLTMLPFTGSNGFTIYFLFAMLMLGMSIFYAKKSNYLKEKTK